jgi:hypothetical protein
MIPSLILTTAILLQTATPVQSITALKSRAEAGDVQAQVQAGGRLLPRVCLETL